MGGKKKRGKTAHTRDRRSGQWQSDAPQPHKVPPTLPEGPEPGSRSQPYIGRPKGSLELGVLRLCPVAVPQELAFGDNVGARAQGRPEVAYPLEQDRH